MRMARENVSSILRINCIFHTFSHPDTRRNNPLLIHKSMCELEIWNLRITHLKSGRSWHPLKKAFWIPLDSNGFKDPSPQDWQQIMNLLQRSLSFPNIFPTVCLHQLIRKKIVSQHWTAWCEELLLSKTKQRKRTKIWIPSFLQNTAHSCLASCSDCCLDTFLQGTQMSERSWQLQRRQVALSQRNQNSLSMPPRLWLAILPKVATFIKQILGLKLAPVSN